MFSPPPIERRGSGAERSEVPSTRMFCPIRADSIVFELLEYVFLGLSQSLLIEHRFRNVKCDSIDYNTDHNTEDYPQ